MPISLLSEEKLTELRARMNAAPLLPWEGIPAHIEHAMSLVRPGGMMAVILPDGRPFFARKQLTPDQAAPSGQAFIQGRPASEVPTFRCPRCGMTSTYHADVEQGYCGSCHDWTGAPSVGSL